MDAFLIALALFAGLMLLSSWNIGSQFRDSKVGYLLSNRDVGVTELSSSIVASWIHLFAFVMVSAFVFTKGFAGFFWFILPTVIVLLMMSAVSSSLLAQNNRQFTLSGFIQERYGSTTLTRIFQAVMLFGVLNAVVANLTAFGGIATYVGKSSITYEAVVIGVAAIVLLYSLWGGLKSSIRTDMLQTGVMLLIAVGLGGAAVAAAGGFGTVWDAVQTKTNVSLWDPATVTNIGIMTIFILVGSSLNDNGFYQRIFAANDVSKIRRAFLLSIPIYLVILIGFGIMAGSAVPLGLEVKDPKLAGTMVSEFLLGQWGLVLITLAFLAASASTIDTAYNSFGSIISNDFMPDRDAVKVSRIAMVFIALVTTVIALFKIDIWIIFITFGTARLLTIAPVLYGVFSRHQAQVRFMLWGVLAAIVVGVLGHFNALPLERWMFSAIMIALPALGIILDRRSVPKLA
jgi:Na+/proline symporter